MDHAVALVEACLQINGCFTVTEYPVIGSIGKQYYGVATDLDIHACRFPDASLPYEHRADAIAAGYLFDTDMADGIYAVVSDDLAPKGYAYLLMNRGRGTLATCLFEDFHKEREYLERCVAFFDDKIGVHMEIRCQ